MEVSGKGLQNLLLAFLKDIGAMDSLHGTEKQAINDFIETFYPALWNENMRNT